MAQTLRTQPPSGFRDFVGKPASERERLKALIAKVYESFGFLCLQSSALEKLEVLQGSGGQENEKLIFKILKRGEKLQQILDSDRPLEASLCDLGLRFDLTVPLARVVGEIQGQTAFPLKIFQIGPVWRAERAQKGRFREFYQCDVDIVGASSWLAEWEVIQAVSKAFKFCGIEDLNLVLNHRKLIESLAKRYSYEEHLDAFAIALDKKDKCSPEQLEKEFFNIKKASAPKDLMETLLKSDFSEEDLEGLDNGAKEELLRLKAAVESIAGYAPRVQLDLSLVRGMGYYTGCVFEFKRTGTAYSLGGGGRYDSLMSRFSKKPLAAVGCSLGFERLLLELASDHTTDFDEESLFVPQFEDVDRAKLHGILELLREEGLKVDLFPGVDKLKQQLKYASQKKIRWVLILGSSEISLGMAQLKDFKSGAEHQVRLDELQEQIKKFIL